MAYDYSKLNGRIIEKCGTQAVFAERMGLSERTVSLKLNNKVAWKQPEMQKAAGVLEFPKLKFRLIFLQRKFKVIELYRKAVNRMKKVIAACIDRILEFDTQQEAANYLEGLRTKKTEFRIINREEINGKYRDQDSGTLQQKPND